MAKFICIKIHAFEIFLRIYPFLGARRLGGGGGRVPTQRVHGPPLQFPNQLKSISFSFKHQGYFFLHVFRDYTDQQISRFLLCMLQFLDNLRRHFIFSNYIWEIYHFKLDLLNRPNTKPGTF